MNSNVQLTQNTLKPLFYEHPKNLAQTALKKQGEGFIYTEIWKRLQKKL